MRNLSCPGRRLPRSRRKRHRASMPRPAQRSRTQTKRATPPRKPLQSRPTKPSASLELSPDPARPKHNGRATNPQPSMRLRRGRQKRRREAPTKMTRATTTPKAHSRFGAYKLTSSMMTSSRPSPPLANAPVECRIPTMGSILPNQRLLLPRVHRTIRSHRNRASRRGRLDTCPMTMTK